MAQGFQRNIPGQEPATYINQGVADQPDQSASILISGADAIGGAVKQGYGTGLGEKIMQDTLDEFLSVQGQAQPSGEVQSIGLDGTVQQWDGQGNQIGTSGQIDPNLSGEARSRAIQESTKQFNTQAQKIQRAYESGLIDDRELRARMSLNLKEAEQKYPAFKQEIADQARKMLSDDLYYYHYSSAVSGIEAMRQQRESAQAEAADRMEQLRFQYAKDISKEIGVDPRLVYQEPERFQDIYGRLRQEELADEARTRAGNALEYSTKVADHKARQKAEIYRGIATDTSKTIMMDVLGVGPEQLTIGLGGAKDQQKAMMRDRIKNQRDAQVQQVLGQYPNMSRSQRDSLISRIETPYNEAIQAIDEPALLGLMESSNNIRSEEIKAALPDSLKRLGVVSQMIAGLSPTAQQAILADISGPLKQDVINFLSAQENYDPANDNNAVDEETVNTGNEMTSKGIDELTNNTTDYPENSQAKQELYKWTRNMFHNVVTKTAHLLDNNQATDYSTVRGTVDNVIKMSRTNPELLSSMDEATRNVASNNIQQMVTTATTKVGDFLSQGEMTSLSVDPNTGMIRMSGDTGSRYAAQQEQSRTALTIGSGTPPSVRGQSYVKQLNKAIRAQAALSGDTSVATLRQVSKAMVGRLRAASGDEAEIRDYVAQLAPAYGIPVEMATAMALQESGFDPNAVSNKGAAGVMQIMPATGRDLGLSEEDRFDPVKAVPAGLTYLKQHMDSAKSLDPQIKEREQRAVALAMYNAGPGATRAYLTGESDALETSGSYEQRTGYGETRHYIDKILGGKGTWKLLKNVRNRLVYSEDTEE